METTDVSFTAKDVMTLRQRTGLGMMDCKQALTESNGDLDAAEEWLRHKLKGKMAGRTERATGEGLIGIAIEGSNAAIVEIRTETDFTARNEAFITMVDDVTTLALTQPAGSVQATDDIAHRIDDIRITTGENVNFARGEKLEGGSFGKYIHHDGKRAALLQLDGTADTDLLTGICQHIVAHVPPPIAVSAQDVSAQITDRVRAEAVQEAAESGKPPEIAEKIAEGKVRKFFQLNTLLDQIYVKDASGKTPVKKILPQGLTINRFVRYTVGAE
ncbi:MAG: translation elongation factor Ts [Planctomycetota bacterium]|jgi:elongation factor Ts